MWFHADVDLEHHSKSLTLRSRLGWTSDQLLARMHRFLAWMRRENPDGEMTGVDPGVLALTMGAKSADGPRIVHAMIEVGLIDVVDDPGSPESTPKLLCHNWMERNGRWIRDAERKRLSRDSPRTHNGQDADCRSSRARTPAPGAGGGVGVGVGVGVGEKTLPTPPPDFKGMELPDWMNRQTWENWCEYRRRTSTKKAPWTAGSAVLTIKTLERMRAEGQNLDRVVEQSILNGWRGLFAVSGPKAKRTYTVDELIAGAKAMS